MNDEAYPKWVGVVLGLLVNGAAHFLSGNRLAGVRWYFAIIFISIAGELFLAAPGVLAYVISIALSFLALALWLAMLKQSYRPVRRIGIRGWLAIVVLGQNEYFVLGDNTASSLDSRYYGAISGNHILGRISRIYWPISRIDKLL